MKVIASLFREDRPSLQPRGLFARVRRFVRIVCPKFCRKRSAEDHPGGRKVDLEDGEEQVRFRGPGERQYLPKGEKAIFTWKCGLG